MSKEDAKSWAAKMDEVLAGTRHLAIASEEDMIVATIVGRSIERVERLTGSSVSISFTDGVQMVIDAVSKAGGRHVRQGSAALPEGWEAQEPTARLRDVRINRYPARELAGGGRLFEVVDLAATCGRLPIRIARFWATCAQGSLTLTASVSRRQV